MGVHAFHHDICAEEFELRKRTMQRTICKKATLAGPRLPR